MNTQKEYAKHIVTLLGNALWADPSGTGQWKSPEALRIVETALQAQIKASVENVKAAKRQAAVMGRTMTPCELEDAIGSAAPQIPAEAV